MTTARPTAARPGARPAARPAARPGAVVFTLAFAGIVVSLMQTLIIRNHLTGEDGAYAFDGLAGSEFTLVATGYPPASTAVSLQGGGRDGVDLALAHGAD